MELVRRIRDGDADAFARLFRCHRDRVYGLAVRLAPDRDQADDVVVEAFAAAWRGFDRFEGESRVSTWICSIAANLCRNRVRARQRERRRLSPHPPSMTADPGSPARVDVRIDLERAIDALPDRARETLVLRHIYGFSLRETADAMGVTQGTVKSQLSRACRLIRERLADV